MTQLSRRERQIMDIVYAHGAVTAAQVLGELPDPPSYSAVRALLRILEEKGHLKHKQEGAKYVYIPTEERGSAGGAALRGVVQTFYDGSVSRAVAALMGGSGKLSEKELGELRKLIEEARKGRK